MCWVLLFIGLRQVVINWKLGRLCSSTLPWVAWQGVCCSHCVKDACDITELQLLKLHMPVHTQKMVTTLYCKILFIYCHVTGNLWIQGSLLKTSRQTLGGCNYKDPSRYLWLMAVWFPLNYDHKLLPVMRLTFIVLCNHMLICIKCDGKWTSMPCAYFCVFSL